MVFVLLNIDLKIQRENSIIGLQLWHIHTQKVSVGMIEAREHSFKPEVRKLCCFSIDCIPQAVPFIP